MQRFSAILVTISLVLFSAKVSAETNVCNAGIGGTGISNNTIQQDGIGGTGHQPEGIGGTGHQPKGVGGTGKQADSGVGGTGVQGNAGIGGTGIIGVITGFASVCVNGLEVHYDNQTLVDIDGQSSSIDALNLGQLVAIESINKGDLLEAERISVSHILVGKIEKINLTQNTIQILGKTISYSHNTLGSADLKLNQTVQLSGLITANNQVHALRIDVVPPNTPSSIVGFVDSTGKINGVNISTANKLNVGSSIHVSGLWDGRTLQSKQIKESVIQRVLSKSENIVIQGIAPARSTSNINVQNQSIRVDANTKIKGSNLDNNQTIIVRGNKDSAGNITARSIEYLTEDKILERGGSKQRPNVIEDRRSDSAKEHTKPMLDSDKLETNDNHNKLEATDKPEGAEILDHIEKTDKVERPEKVDRTEKVDRPEKVDRSTSVERPEVPRY